MKDVFLDFKKIIENLDSFDNSTLKEEIHVIEKFVLCYVNCNSVDRKKVNLLFGFKDYLKLLNISDWLIEEGLNKKDKKLVFYSLIFHSVEGFRFDIRENIIRLTVIWDVAKRLKFGVKKIFKESLLYFDEKGKVQMSEFINRPKYLKNIKSMGLCYKKENNRTIITQTDDWV
ncbi:hypothetical protein [Tenacibaculum maritimum]|uniref:hypothetical protein n=2 Tax=Tenacibaculum maritimum TaxID=107401 RepID=UPI0012E648A1|nr:hypothetical protein [Tenacibaculum maritimum]CAA0163032.1 hypothetical protein TFA04_110101 [Tenacibaculum maritimum]